MSLKLGIRSKLFAISIALIVLAVVAADAWLTQTLAEDLTRHVERDLVVRANLARREVAASDAGADDLAAWDTVADGLAGDSGARVTIIRDDGVVLGDSELDPSAVAAAENHLGRPEVRAALEGGGAGSSTRLSATMQERMLYVAVPFESKGRVRGVTRMAMPLTAVDEATARLSRAVYIASGITLGLSALLWLLAAHLISRSVRDFTWVARRLSSGDLEARTRAKGQDEVGELGRALDQLATSLSSALTDLRDERDLLGRVLDGMREGVLLVDEEGRVALTNPALRQMLLIGGSVSGRRPLELVRSAELSKLLDEVKRTGETQAVEVDLGELKPRKMLIHGTPLADGGTLAVFVDVTDLRRLESMRKDFVANVSHELRTPVATVLSAAETLRRAGLVKGEAAEFAEMIERNAERLHQLVEDLLDLSKIESGELRLEIQPVDPGPVIDATLAIYRERADAKKVRLVADVKGGAKVLVDQRALEQIVSNLIDNAVKYTHERSSVTISSRVNGRSVVLSIADTGPGIESKHLPRIFERFYRADAGRSRELGGTGLGLSIVKHLTEAMGGEVSVESAPGAGTKFLVELPRA